MKLLIVRSLLLVGMALGFSTSYGQTSVANCPKKGTADCPIVKNCPKKGTKDWLYTASFASQSTNAAKAENCPLKGTLDCPLIKNCPKKGTAECPLVKMESTASYAAKKTIANKKDDADLPACCKKGTN
jgi:hypothetical protein